MLGILFFNFDWDTKGTIPATPLFLFTSGDYKLNCSK